MKEFKSPNFEVVENLYLEPVYAMSGTGSTTGGGTTPSFGDWDLRTEWRNHNSGSHSELWIGGTYNGKPQMNEVTMDFACVGFKLDTLTPCGCGDTVVSKSETGFRIKYTQCMNHNFGMGFVIQLTCKGGKYHGAVGKTGETCSEYVAITGISAS